MLYWTRTELEAFKSYDDAEMELASLSSDAMWCSPNSNSPIMKQIEELAKYRDEMYDNLKALMGKTRFNKLMNDTRSLRKWRGEITARYIAKYPWLTDEIDCRPGWDS